jgi:hypothetical protein
MNSHAYQGPRGPVARLRRTLLVSSGILAVAMAAGCGAVGTSGKTAASDPSSALKLTLGTIPTRTPSDTSPAQHKSSSPAASHSPTSTTGTHSQAAGGPAPTTNSPAPSSTPVSSPAGTGSVCVTSAAQGSCGPYSYSGFPLSNGPITVAENVWSPISGWAQTLYSTNPGSWYVTANMPAGNTAVVSYPNTGAGYGEQKLSSFSSITSSFADTMPHNGSTSGWAAYDLWFNNWNDEVMVQNDFTDNGPCGYEAVQTFGGSNGVPSHLWGLCVFGSERVWKLAAPGSAVGSTGTVNESSGSVDLLSMLTWMENNGYLPKNSTVTDLSYGFEICSTGGKPENFSVSRFSISAQ